MDWWCEHSTVVVGPKTSAATEPGTVSTSTSLNREGGGAVRQGADHVGHVLVQRPAQLHVEDLAAAADGQHRQVGPQRGGQQGALAGVPVGVDAAHLGPGLLAVGERVHVAPAGEHQAVEDVYDLVGAGLGAEEAGARRGQEQGAPARRGP